MYSKPYILYILQNNISCKTSQSVTELKTIFSKEIKQEISNGSIIFNGLYFIRFEDSLLKCYWKNKPFDCANAFINRIGDFGPCFTFNPGKSVALEFLNGQIGPV